METMNKKQFENEVKENLKSVKDFAKSSVEDFFKDTKIMFVCQPTTKRVTAQSTTTRLELPSHWPRQLRR